MVTKLSLDGSHRSVVLLTLSQYSWSVFGVQLHHLRVPTLTTSFFVSGM